MTQQGGFTLIELLVVIIITGILLAIAVPSYLGFRDRATRSANQGNLRAAIPAAEAYAADNDGTGTDSDLNASTIGYAGMSLTELTDIDAGISPPLRVGLATSTQYCLESGADGSSFEYKYSIGATAPNGAITQASC